MVSDALGGVPGVVVSAVLGAAAACGTGAGWGALASAGAEAKAATIAVAMNDGRAPKVVGPDASKTWLRRDERFERMKRSSFGGRVSSCK